MGGAFAAAARNTMRPVCSVQLAARRDCRDQTLPLPNIPTLGTFNSGTAWPHHSAGVGGGGECREEERGRKPRQGWPWEDVYSSRKNICLEMLLRF